MRAPTTVPFLLVDQVVSDCIFILSSYTAVGGFGGGTPRPLGGGGHRASVLADLRNALKIRDLEAFARYSASSKSRATGIFDAGAAAVADRRYLPCGSCVTDARRQSSNICWRAEAVECPISAPLNCQEN
jgi:hypothetical protein